MSQAILGLPLLVFLAWLISSDRARFPWRFVVVGLALQFVLALLFLKVPLLQDFLMVINRMVLAVEAATQQGTSLVFGFLGGGAEPYAVTAPQNTFILAFRALPLVLVFAALAALLWHWRVLPWIIGLIARLLTRSMQLSGAVGMGSAASIFVGMVESPLLIKPYLERMSRSDLFMIMSCGMATVAGTMLALYAGILTPVIPNALSHILVASLISAPAAITLAAVMLPPGPAPGATSTETDLHYTSPYNSSMEALVSGTGEGLRLLANIIGMLIVFVALVYLVDLMLGLIPGTSEPLTLEGVFGALLMPLAWLIGIPWAEAEAAGQLLATKVFLNELVAFLNLSAIEPGTLSEKSELILAYALCGFANLGSLGIMIGGLSALCPARTRDILELAPRSVISGLLATCMTGAVVGLVA